MLVSTVIDPLAFEPSMFVEPGYPQKAEAMLAGLVENGLILIDCSEQLRDGIVLAAEQLDSIPQGRNSRIWIEEFLKLGKRRIVKTMESDAPPQNASPIEKACHVGVRCGVDAIVTCQEHADDDRIRALAGRGLLCLNEYSNLHPFETARKKLAQETFQIDTLANGDLLTLFEKTVRFTKWLRFYDAQIGRAGQNLWSFLEGIRKVLDVFRDRGYFANQPGGFVEIYTKQRVLDEAAFGRISNDLVRPLREHFPWTVRLFVKEDPHNIFHARFLESQNVIVNFDGGFDLFKANRNLKVNLVRMDEKRISLVEQFRQLRNLYEDVR